MDRLQLAQLPWRMVEILAMALAPESKTEQKMLIRAARVQAIDDMEVKAKKAARREK